MGRLAPAIAAAAIALLLAPGPAAAADPPTARGRGGAPGKSTVRQLEEIRIVGNPERPDILFFLPRAKFRLLPMKSEADWREEILRDDIEKADVSR